VFFANLPGKKASLAWAASTQARHKKKSTNYFPSGQEWEEARARKGATFFSCKRRHAAV
jgi:hypothetical protein